MKEFRVAKCLENGKVSDYAIFADGSRKKIIETDKDGNRYFSVDNELNTSGKHLLRTSFTGRIKDAIDTIKSGNGDVICTHNLFGIHVEVYYFLDREIGESYRKRSIEGYKDSKFGAAIEFGSKESMNGAYMLNTNREPITMFNEGKEREVMYFETEEAAKKYMENVLKEVFEAAKKIVAEVEKADSVDEKKAAFYAAVDKFYESCNSKMDMESDFIFDMMEEKSGEDWTISLKSDKPELDKYYYNIIQHLWVKDLEEKKEA